MALIGTHFFETIDTCFNLFLSSVCAYAYTVLYDLYIPVHKGGYVVGVATMIMMSCALVCISTLLLHLHKIEGSSTSDGFYTIIAGIVAFVLSSIILVLPTSYTGFEIIETVTYEFSSQVHSFIETLGYANIGKH